MRGRPPWPTAVVTPSKLPAMSKPAGGTGTNSFGIGRGVYWAGLPGSSGYAHARVEHGVEEVDHQIGDADEDHVVDEDADRGGVAPAEDAADQLVAQAGHGGELLDDQRACDQ